MLDALHTRLRSHPFFYRFTAFTRVLLALGFIPQGLKKVLGIPFTILSPDTPVGYFFDAFFQAEAFYVFVGAAQMLAGLLLLVPRTATLGAVLFAPIILNISVITYAVGFYGTWIITLLMALACLYLLCWDYDRLKGILPVRLRRNQRFGTREYVRQAFVWALAGAVTYGIAAAIGLANAWGMMGALGFVIVPSLGALFGVILAWHLGHMPPLDPAP